MMNLGHWSLKRIILLLQIYSYKRKKLYDIGQEHRKKRGKNKNKNKTKAGTKARQLLKGSQDNTTLLCSMHIKKIRLG